MGAEMVLRLSGSCKSDPDVDGEGKTVTGEILD